MLVSALCLRAFDGTVYPARMAVARLLGNNFAFPSSFVAILEIFFHPDIQTHYYAGNV